MSDFFKSAMGYFGNEAPPNTNSSTNFTTMDNEYCGQVVEIAGHKLRVKRVIAEGGFS